MNAVELRTVSLALSGRVILDDISLDIAAGEFIGVLGPNGAGKTTLMRAILGLLPPRRGTIRVFGRAATRGSPEIGYVPQTRSAGAGLLLSGRNFVAAAVNGHRLGLPLPGKAQRAEIELALERVGARDLAERPLAQLSGGERQRLLLAQALIGQPRLLLLDEPLISLDPRRQTEIVALAASLQRALGVTVLFSAHELNPLLGAVDRVLYLGNGQAALGAVDEVIAGPVLSRLYGADIEVVRLGGRIFVMSGGHDMESAAHQHENGHGHGGAHSHDHAVPEPGRGDA
ncbi:MAG: metal ABC transporter ATP-binding protein [Stellaceae bacterium]